MRVATRWTNVAVLGLAAALFANAQAPTVSPKQLLFTMVTGGPQGASQTLVVQTSKHWTAKTDSQGTWLSLTPSSGTGLTNVSVGLSSDSTWRPPATISTQITVTTDDGATANVSVSLTIIGVAAGPTFSYLAGPVGCVGLSGLPDQALCQVPDERPPGKFTPPAVGGSYIDPNFGAAIRILAPARSLHGYSAPASLSANRKYALIAVDGFPLIWDVAAAKQVGPSPTWIEGVFWDLKDDNVFYFLSGAAIKKYNVQTQALSTFVDYSAPPFNFTRISSGSRGDVSRDNWMPLFAPNENMVCALDMANVRTYCGKYDRTYHGITLGDLAVGNPGAIITKGADKVSGKRYVILELRPTIAIFSVNPAANRLDFESLGPEILDWGGNNDGICDPGESCLVGDHYDTFEDENGAQYLMGTVDGAGNLCGRILSSFRLNAGAKMSAPEELGGGWRRILMLFRCGTSDIKCNGSSGYDIWVDWHLACAKGGHTCVVSTTYTDFAVAFDANSMGPICRSPHMSEIFVVRDNGKEIRRLAEHRSVPLTGETDSFYWDTPRAGISNDGSFVIADSNFGVPDKNQVILVETGYGPTKIDHARGLVDAASLQPAVSSGEYATLYGENLAHCRTAADGTLTLPTSICGTTVLVNGQQAHLSYVSPGQINFLVPESIATRTSLHVSVTRGSTPDDTDSLDVPGTAVSDLAPAMFSWTSSDGVQRAIVQYLDGSLNGPDRPMRLNDYGILYVNGLGPTNPAIPDGVPAPGNSLVPTVNPVHVSVNGVDRTVSFAGLAPTLAGLYAVIFQLDGAPVVPGDGSIQVRAGDKASPVLKIRLAN